MDEIDATAPPIAIVGNLNLDIKTSPIAASEAILADGETSVAEIYETIGGGGANAAVAAATLGGRVHFCGCVGRDALGARLIAYLQSLAIIPHVARKVSPTGRSIALTWDNHHRHFVSCLPSCAELDESDIDMEALARAGCRHLYRADIWFAPRMLAAGNLAILRRARAAGMETSIDINWDPKWNRGESSFAATARPEAGQQLVAQSPSAVITSETGRNFAEGFTVEGDCATSCVSSAGHDVAERIAAVRALLPYVSCIHGNRRELAHFTRTPDTRQAVAALLDAGAETVVVHCGAEGSIAATHHGWIEAPPVPVSRIVSETGTGDVFTAAFLLLGHLPLPDRLRACNRIAARHLAGEPSYIPRLPSNGEPAV
jgi:sugar/nucleoside kinase (ribokinase family)